MIDLPLAEPCRAGISTPICGDASFTWLSAATELVQHGRCQALVTAPIAKASWHAAGHPYPGQTERLAELAGRPDASMLFTAVAPSGQWRLNTLLATTHIPLAAVPQQRSRLCAAYSPHSRPRAAASSHPCSAHAARSR